MKLTNYKILFIFRIIKTLLNLFMDSFFVLYFINLSNKNILPFGRYKLVSITVLYITIVLLRNKILSKNRINLLKIGLILYLLFFILIIILKEKIVNYMYLIGIIYGLEEGFYFSVFNILESDNITNKERHIYNGNYKSISNILSIIFPLIFSSIIVISNFNISFILIIILISILLILSYKIKDICINKKKTNIKEYLKIVKEEKAIKHVYNSNLFSGLTYSSGAFLSIITIYIIKVSNTFSFGLYSSIIGIIIAIIALLFGHVIKKNKYNLIIYTTTLLSIVSLLFSLLSKINWEFIYLINVTSQGNLTNINSIKNKYKVEFYQLFELSLFIGRFISYILFILIAIIPINYILPIFILFIVLLMINSIKIQKNM